MIHYDDFSDVCQGMYIFQDDLLQVGLALPGASWKPAFGAERFGLEAHLNRDAVLCLDLAPTPRGWGIVDMCLVCPDGGDPPDDCDEIVETFVLRLERHLLAHYSEEVFLWN